MGQQIGNLMSLMNGHSRNLPKEEAKPAGDQAGGYAVPDGLSHQDAAAEEAQ